MILLVVWDGLRPDMISDELAPYLARMGREGVFCRSSHAVWPSATRINAAALTTGCYPAKHGLVDNELYVPAVDPAKPFSCADWRLLQAMADAEGGPLLTAPTLGQVLQQHGRRMASGGSGSPGTTYLTNPTVTGPIVNWAVAWPAALGAKLQARYRAFGDDQADSVTRNRLVIDALREVLLPATAPDVVTLWLTEPDHAQHGYGLRSAEAVAMLRHVDAEVEALVTELSATLDEPLTVFCLSDHGFDTIGYEHPVQAALIEAGFKATPTSTDVVRASNSLYLDAATLPRVGELAGWLLEQPWVSAVFVRDDLWGAPGVAASGALPQSAAGGGHRRSAPLMYSPRWSDGVNGEGVPGLVAGRSGGNVATHGSTSPYALRNTLVAWGAGIKRQTVSDVPCGIVDVAPTVLHLLGIAPPATMDGRVLYELLAEGPAPETAPVFQSAREGVGATRRQVARYAEACGKMYLEQVAIEA